MPNTRPTSLTSTNADGERFRTMTGALTERGQDRSIATLYHGNREVSLELRGLPFGSVV